MMYTYDKGTKHISIRKDDIDIFDENIWIWLYNI